MIIEIFRPDQLIKVGKLICLDRDDTLIKDFGYMDDTAELIVNVNLIKFLETEKGSSLCLVSNQSGIGRGLLTIESVLKLNRRLEQILIGYDLKLTLSIFCPHSPEANCDCRKPKPAMLNTVKALHSFDSSEISLMIGDRESDRIAAALSGFDFKEASDF